MRIPPAATDFYEFCAAARTELTMKAEQLKETNFELLKSIDGIWHPNGFAVFHLNKTHHLGNLRLHIWPENERVTRPNGATIHTHAWHLCSLVIRGSYAETLFESAQPGELEAKKYFSASIDYLRDQNAISNPRLSILKPTVTATVRSVEFHEVAASIPHETHIPNKSFTATLLFTSPPVAEEVLVYSDGEVQMGTYERPVVAREQKTALINQLLVKESSKLGRKNE